MGDLITAFILGGIATAIATVSLVLFIGVTFPKKNKNEEN